MSAKSHLICRNHIYYYRIKVPTDLRHLIPVVEIKKSLKTSEHDKAHSLAAAMGYKVHAAFVQLRTGMLSDKQANAVVNQRTAKAPAGTPSGLSAGALFFWGISRRKPGDGELRIS